MAPLHMLVQKMRWCAQRDSGSGEVGRSTHQREVGEGAKPHEPHHIALNSCIKVRVYGVKLTRCLRFVPVRERV